MIYEHKQQITISSKIYFQKKIFILLNTKIITCTSRSMLQRKMSSNFVWYITNEFGICSIFEVPHLNITYAVKISSISNLQDTVMLKQTTSYSSTRQMFFFRL